MKKPTYDQKQAAAVLKTCTACGVDVYATRPTDPYVCILCVRDQEQRA